MHRTGPFSMAPEFRVRVSWGGVDDPVSAAESPEESEPSLWSWVTLYLRAGSQLHVTADLCNKHQAVSSLYSQPSSEHFRSTQALSQLRTLLRTWRDGRWLLSYGNWEVHIWKITRNTRKAFLAQFALHFFVYLDPSWHITVGCLLRAPRMNLHCTDTV